VPLRARPINTRGKQVRRRVAETETLLAQLRFSPTAEEFIDEGRSYEDALRDAVHGGYDPGESLEAAIRDWQRQGKAHDPDRCRPRRARKRASRRRRGFCDCSRRAGPARLDPHSPNVLMFASGERRFVDGLRRAYAESLSALETGHESPETTTLLAAAMAGAQDSLRCFVRGARRALRHDPRLDGFRTRLVEQAEQGQIEATFRLVVIAYVARLREAQWKGPWKVPFERAAETFGVRAGVEERVLQLESPRPETMSAGNLDPGFAEFQITVVGALLEAATGHTVDIGSDALAYAWSTCFTNGLKTASAFLESYGARHGADMSALR
jgi:hypothetical protein